MKDDQQFDGYAHVSESEQATYESHWKRSKPITAGLLFGGDSLIGSPLAWWDDFKPNPAWQSRPSLWTPTTPPKKGQVFPQRAWTEPNWFQRRILGRKPELVTTYWEVQ
jgi:hypothetical protein